MPDSCSGKRGGACGCGGLFFPKGFGEQHHDGEHFQAAYEHEEGEENFCKVVEVREAVHRAYASESRAYVAHAGDNGAASGDDVLGEEGHNDASDGEYEYKEDEESHDAGHDTRVDAFVVVFYVDDAVGVDNPFQFDE